MTTQSIFHLLSILLTGLLAGLFYGYDCSVIKGLGMLNDKEYLSAFQDINKAILNPYFFASFIGCLVVLPIATWLSYTQGLYHQFYYLTAATILYFIGVCIVTGVANVPLNNALENFNIAESTPEMIRVMRKKFETDWNKWHHIRTYAAILVFLLSIIPLIKKS